MKKNWLKRLAKAIKNDRFSFEYGSRTWHGENIYVSALFCSYGKIGYSIDVEDLGTLQYDYELGRLLLTDNLIDYGGPEVDLFDEDAWKQLEGWID